MTTPAAEERVIDVGDLGERYARLRILDDGSLRAMRESLARHGQLQALAAYQPPRSDGAGAFEIIDGFKRLRAARELGWVLLRVRVLALDAAGAKVAMGILNHGRALAELEEAWLVRSLVREDGLTQPVIGRLLGRHKSWVSRRLLLAEGLDDAVQADVRLGLISTSTATAVARLPRCNQRAAAEAVMKRGLTYYQTDRLVADVMSRPASERAAALAQALGRIPEGAAPPRGTRRSTDRTPAQWLMADVGAATQIAARLQARLWERPLAALGEPAAQLVRDGLAGLAPVLGALGRTIERAITTDRRGDAHVEDPPRA